MVNGLENTKSAWLSEATLQARFFADPLGLFKSRLHTWLKVSGLEPTDRKPGETRLFSPHDVLTITTLWWLKRNTDVALARHHELISFLTDTKIYGERVIAIWEAGLTPALITDFRADNSIVALEKVDLSLAEMLKSDVTTFLRLSSVVEFALQAVRLGGSYEQRAHAERKFSNRALATEEFLREQDARSGSSGALHSDPAPHKRSVNLD